MIAAQETEGGSIEQVLETAQARRQAPVVKGTTVRKSAKAARRNTKSGGSKGNSRAPRQSPGLNAQAAVRNGTKQAMLVGLLRTAGGVSVPEMAAQADWQPHSVRGFLSGTVKKKLGLVLASKTVEGRGRVYRIAKRS